MMKNSTLAQLRDHNNSNSKDQNTGVSLSLRITDEALQKDSLLYKATMINYSACVLIQHIFSIKPDQCMCVPVIIQVL